MKAKYFYLFIISILLFSQNCFNQEINQTLNDKFQEANYLYNDSKYEKSIEKYFEIIDAGFHSPELYFNLDLPTLADKKEVDVLFELDDETYNGLFSFSKRVAAAIKKSFDCNRVGMSVVGLEVPHAHIHLMPISSLDDMNFFKAKKVLSNEELSSIAHQIAENFI